jgi:murein DD-endopeptidase MepM/ murein hydrolase activator NlpD
LKKLILLTFLFLNSYIVFSDNKNNEPDTVSAIVMYKGVSNSFSFNIKSFSPDIIFEIIDSIRFSSTDEEVIRKADYLESVIMKNTKSIEKIRDSLLLSPDDYELVNFINIYLVTKKNEYFYSHSNSLIGFYESEVFPAHHIYNDWDTENTHCHHLGLFESDTCLKTTINLTDSINFCGYTHPFDGVVTSKFGPRNGRHHYGIDIGLWTGAPIQAAFDGMVRIARNHGGYGNVVVIRHYNGLETLYAHLKKIDVKPGQIVNSGDIIGLGGNTGRSRGSHLHLEVRYKGIAINPQQLIDFQEQKIIENEISLIKNKYGYQALPSNAEFHVVKKGDYLHQISETYGISIDKICKLNNISRNKILTVGQKLRIS